MQHIKKVGPVLVVVWAIGAMFAPGASASLFLEHRLGTITIKALSNHVFVTGPEQQFVTTCTAVSAAESELVLNLQLLLSLAVNVKYEKCTLNGLAATVTTGRWLYRADGGSVKLLENITITAEACTITIPSIKNLQLATAKYLNIGIDLVIDNNGRLGSEGAGASCTYGSESQGTYTGVTLVGIRTNKGTNGTVRWDP